MIGGGIARKAWAVGLLGAALVAGGVAYVYHQSGDDSELSASIVKHVVWGIKRQTPIESITKHDVRLSGLRLRKVGQEDWVDGWIEVRRRKCEPMRDVTIEGNGWFRTKFRSLGSTRMESGFNAFGQPVKRGTWVAQRVIFEPTAFWTNSDKAWQVGAPVTDLAYDGWLEGLVIEDLASPIVETTSDSLETRQVAWVLLGREFRKAGKKAEARRALWRSKLTGVSEDMWTMRTREERILLDEMKN